MEVRQKFIRYIVSGIASGTAAAVFLSWVPSFQAKLVHALIQEPSFPMEFLTSFLVYTGQSEMCSPESGWDWFPTPLPPPLARSQVYGDHENLLDAI